MENKLRCDSWLLLKQPPFVLLRTISKLNETFLELEVWLELYQPSTEQRLHEILRMHTVGHPLKRSGHMMPHDKRTQYNKKQGGIQWAMGGRVISAL